MTLLEFNELASIDGRPLWILVVFESERSAWHATLLASWPLPVRAVNPGPVPHIAWCASFVPRFLAPAPVAVDDPPPLRGHYDK